MGISLGVTVRKHSSSKSGPGNNFCPTLNIWREAHVVDHVPSGVSAVTMIGALAVVAYLRTPLYGILVDLCGTRDRAAFWIAFSNVTLALLPLIFAMQYTPEVKAGKSVVLEVAAQLKWAMAGLLSAVVVLGWVLSRFIRRQIVHDKPTAKAAA